VHFAARREVFELFLETSSLGTYLGSQTGRSFFQSGIFDTRSTARDKEPLFSYMCTAHAAASTTIGIRPRYLLQASKQGSMRLQRLMRLPYLVRGSSVRSKSGPCNNECPPYVASPLVLFIGPKETGLVRVLSIIGALGSRSRLEGKLLIKPEMCLIKLVMAKGGPNKEDCLFGRIISRVHLVFDVLK
jgi:hypothetical protein